MSRLCSCFLATLFLIIGAGNELFSEQLPAGTPEVRGAWVARRADERQTGKDSRLTMRMRLFDRQDRVRERALTVVGLRGGAGRPVPADRSLIRFTYPNDIAGTAFLVWDQPVGDAERFLYLPSLGRVRRIAGSEAQESFVGSDFTYEDIGGRDLDDYSYSLLSDSDVWTAPDGTKHPAYRLESRSKDVNARFPSVVSLILKDVLVAAHAEISNRRAEVQKTFDAQRIEKVGGYWTVLDMVMRDALQRTRTELVIEKAEYDIGLTPDAVSRRELERGAR
jgi:hypothetical protein